MTEAILNDDLITELEFTEALSGLSNDTTSGPDKVKYSDIKNQSVDNKSEFFRLYEDSFAIRQVPEDWSHSIPKLGCLFVGWLLNVPATGECISGAAQNWERTKAN